MGPTWAGTGFLLTLCPLSRHSVGLTLSLKSLPRAGFHPETGIVCQLTSPSRGNRLMSNLQVIKSSYAKNTDSVRSQTTRVGTCAT